MHFKNYKDYKSRKQREPTLRVSPTLLVHSKILLIPYKGLSDENNALFTFLPAQNKCLIDAILRKADSDCIKLQTPNDDLARGKIQAIVILGFGCARKRFIWQCALSYKI